MAKLIKSTDNKDLKKKYASYLFGYICHHTLDSITHPFIFYFSGVRDDNNPKTYIYSNYHKRLEVYLDIFMAEKLGKKGPLEFPMDEIFKLNSLDKSIVYEVHKEVFDSLFNLQLRKKEVDISLNKTASLLHFFPDQKGIKLKFFTFIEKIIRQPYLISKAIVTKDIEDADDYMNLNHEKWLHPCDDSEIRDESYPDLFYKAVGRSYKKINKVYDLLYNEELTEDKIDNIFKNISFETGKPVSKNPKETKIMVNYKVKKI